MAQKVKILMISHDFSMTGAPIALHYAAKALKKLGNFITILSPQDGNMRTELVNDDIPVMIDNTIYNSDYWLKYVKNFDLIIVNTITQYMLIFQLEKIGIPVLWWIHEAEEYYSRVGKLPSHLNDNIHIVCGGAYAKRILIEKTGWSDIGELLYCVPDYTERLKEDNEILFSFPKERRVILSVGTIESRKGQDILVDAIMRLPPEDLDKAHFVFVGKAAEEKIYQKVQILYKNNRDHVTLIEQLKREELQKLYKVCDCIVCSSRQDPMPVFMTEGMMLAKKLVCSENTGTAALLKDGVNGYIYYNNDASELAEKLKKVLNENNMDDNIGILARKVYEENFTVEAFERNIDRIVKSLL